MSIGCLDPFVMEVLSRYPGALTANAAWASLRDRVQDAPEMMLCGSFTLEPLIPHLGLELLRRGIHRRVIVDGFNSALASLIDPSSKLSSQLSVVVLVRLEELIGDAAWSHSSCLSAAAELSRAVSSFAERSKGRIWVGLFPPPCHATSGDLRPKGRVAGWLAANSLLLDSLGHLPTVRLLDTPSFLGKHGASSYDARMWLLARQPYSGSGLNALATGIARGIRAALIPPKKALVLDCDGTIWKGVVGEDGVDGIKLSNDPQGRAHLDLHHWALDLRSRGVLLAICSKNRWEDVDRVFTLREDMLLKKSDIAAWKVNWEAKSQNLVDISVELNIGVDSILMLDDNPAEIGEINANAKEASAFLLPKDVSTWREVLATIECFDADTVTQEDFNRAEMVDAETARKVVAGRLSPEQYLQELGLRVKVRKMDESSIDRVVQLLSKTNQFNLTTRRHDRAGLLDLLARRDWTCLTVHVKDRFGDYGLTGVAIFGPEKNALHVDSVLLSCRVLGRGLETVLMSSIVEAARALKLTAVTAEFIPTDRNSPAERYLPSFGFQPETNFLHRLDVKPDGFPAWPSHITHEGE